MHSPKVTSDGSDVVWLRGVSQGIGLVEENALFGKGDECGLFRGGLLWHIIHVMVTYTAICTVEIGILEPDLGHKIITQRECFAEKL